MSGYARLFSGLTLALLAAYLFAQAVTASDQATTIFAACAGIVCGALGLVLSADGWAVSSAFRRRHQAEADRLAQEAEAQFLESERRRLELWAREDELGIDLDDDGYIGDPVRPRTNRYRPPTPEPAVNVYRGGSSQVQVEVAEFLKSAWTLTLEAGGDPLRKATGLARTNWCRDSDGPNCAERIRYEAIIALLSAPPLNLLAGRTAGHPGRFVMPLEASLHALRQLWPYVDIPAALRSSPAQAATAAGR